MKQKKAVKCLNCEQAKQLNHLKHAFLRVFFDFNPKSAPSPPPIIPGEPSLAPVIPAEPSPKVDIWGKRLIVQDEMTTRLMSFFNQRMDVGGGKKIQAIEFYGEFTDFWRENYPGDPLPSNTSFGRHVARLASSLGPMGIFKNKSNGAIFYNGIGAKDEQQGEA